MKIRTFLMPCLSKIGAFLNVFKNIHYITVYLYRQTSNFKTRHRQRKLNETESQHMDIHKLHRFEPVSVETAVAES